MEMGMEEKGQRRMKKGKRTWIGGEKEMRSRRIGWRNGGMGKKEG